MSYSRTVGQWGDRQRKREDAIKEEQELYWIYWRSNRMMISRHARQIKGGTKWNNEDTCVVSFNHHGLANYLQSGTRTRISVGQPSFLEIEWMVLARTFFPHTQKSLHLLLFIGLSRTLMNGKELGVGPVELGLLASNGFSCGHQDWQAVQKPDETGTLCHIWPRARVHQSERAGFEVTSQVSTMSWQQTWTIPNGCNSTIWLFSSSILCWRENGDPSPIFCLGWKAEERPGVKLFFLGEKWDAFSLGNKRRESVPQMVSWLGCVFFKPKPKSELADGVL